MLGAGYECFSVILLKGIMKPSFGFEISLMRRGEEVCYLRRLLRYGRCGKVRFEYRALDLCSFKASIDGFYLVKDPDAWWREWEFVGRKRQNAGGPQFVSCHSLEIFFLLPTVRNDFNTPIPKGWNHKSNHFLGVLTTVIFSYLMGYLRSCGSKL